MKSSAVNPKYKVLCLVIAASSLVFGCGKTAEEEDELPSTSSVGPVVITSPLAAVVSNSNQLVVAGTCQKDATVVLSGDAAASALCSSGKFSFSITKTTDGRYSFTFRQKLSSTQLSASVRVSWSRDTTAPAAPNVSTPAISPFYSNQNSLTVSGACETGSTVILAGDGTASTLCQSGSYTLTPTKSSDGTFNFLVRQTDSAGNISASRTFTWIRDTISPNQVALTAPAFNPFVSGDPSIVLSGRCEASVTTVVLSGDATDTTNCSAAGTFSFSVSKASDDTYNFSIIQTDLAGNSSNPQPVEWTRDSTIPPTPQVLVPLENPWYSNLNFITLSTSCQADLTPLPAILNLFGDVEASDMTTPSGALSQNCSSSPLDFTIQKTTDGVFRFYLDQDNPNTDKSSAAGGFTWIRDTLPPDAPNIVAPSTSPFTAPGDLRIAGLCEASATVSLSGAHTASSVCAADGSFYFDVTQETDGNYDFTLTQTDRAGNESTESQLTWVRDSDSLQPPVVTTPSVNPLINNLSSLTIAGSCTDGYSLILSGDVVAGDVTSPTGSLTQTCRSQTFSFVIGKSTDGTFVFSIKQRFNGVDSSPVLITWTRDTQAPIATIASHPPAQNLVLDASFSFSSSEDNSTFICSFDSQPFGTCSSPASYTNLTNGNHTFSVRAVDRAGNTSAIASYSWTQAAYKTLALYHFNDPSHLADAGLFTTAAGFSNNLLENGTSANNTSGKLPSATPSSRTLGANVSFSVPSNSSLNLGLKTMTVDGFFRVTTAPSSGGQYFTLVSKSDSSSPNRGWEVRLKRLTNNANSKYVLEFAASLDGTTQTAVQSNQFALSTNGWYYFAVTWNAGTVRFFQGTTSVSAAGSKTIGTVGSASLASTSAPLRIGANATSGTSPSLWFSGQIDEVRISQMVRTITLPTKEFTPD
jgi:hypothetical protein